MTSLRHSRGNIEWRRDSVTYFNGHLSVNQVRIQSAQKGSFKSKTTKFSSCDLMIDFIESDREICIDGIDLLT